MFSLDFESLSSSLLEEEKLWERMGSLFRSLAGDGVDTDSFLESRRKARLFLLYLDQGFSVATVLEKSQ